jgi:cyclomaltodextrinase / maltogenic alpha-amylase / neopullulanase
MLLEAVHHHPGGAFAYPLGPQHLRVRLRARKGDVVRLRIWHADRYEHAKGSGTWTEAEKTGSDLRFDWYEAVLACPTKRVQYLFELHGRDGQTFLYGERGFGADRRESSVFQFPYIHESEVFRVPEWARDAVVCQIFPDRFANGDLSNDPPGTEPWRSEARPRPDSFYGGDLRGVIDRLDYLTDLGVTALYFTPLFLSPSNHKYDTEDYYRIDPAFGDLDTFRELVEEAHRRGIRIILDAVFNHAGDRFFAFRDVLKKGDGSPYKDWFFIDRFPVVQEPAPNYETFAKGIASMPKLRTEHPEVRKYLLGVARYWTRLGIDGWRLDVANEVDHAFWREFRRAVKEINPEALIVGEIWHHADTWLQGDQFDAVMNYRFRDCLLDFFAAGTIDAETFAARLTETRMGYREQASDVLWNLLDSHDTERFLTSCGEKEERMRLAVLFQMTYLGTPLIYYGDEVGMTGGPDPDCRRTMIWEKAKQNSKLRAYYRKLIGLRKHLPPLRRGDVRLWHADGRTGVLGFLRRTQQEAVGTVLNNSGETRRVELNASFFGTRIVADRLTEERFSLENGILRLTFKPWQGMVLTAARSEEKG